MGLNLEPAGSGPNTFNYSTGTTATTLYPGEVVLKPPVALSCMELLKHRLGYLP